MELDLEAAIYNCLNELADLLSSHPEATLEVMIKKYPDVLELIEAEVANRQINEFHLMKQECQ